MFPNLENKVAIVTGVGSVSGAAIAVALAKAGAHVAVNDINPDSCEHVAVAIREEGFQAVAIAADTANRFQCVHLIETTRTQWGRLDILVNCASVRPVAPILKMDEWTWQRCFDVNLKGVFFMCQLVGRVLVDENKEPGGIIINVTAAVEESAETPGLAAFIASQSGLTGFTLACAHEFSPFGIHVYPLPLGSDNRPDPVDQVLRYCNDIG